MITVTSVASLVLKPLIILIWGFSQVESLQRSSAAQRHHLLICSLLFAPITCVAVLIATPLINIGVPEYITNWKVPFWLLTGYVLISIWGICYLFIGVFILTTTQSKSDHSSSEQKAIQELANELAKKMNINSDIHVMLKPNIHNPYSFHHSIVVPNHAIQWPNDQLKLILLHELGHIARKDWRTLIVSKMICWTFWFLPIVWIIEKKIGELSEKACDDLVLNIDNKPAEYADLLLELSKNVSDLPVNHIGHSAHYDRLLSLLEDLDRNNTNKSESLAYLLPLTILAVITILVGIHPHQKISTLTSSTYPIILIKTDETALSSPPLNQRIDKESIFSLPPSSKPKLETLAVIAEPYDLPHLPAIQSVTDIDIQPTNVTIRGHIPLQLVTPKYPSRAIRAGIEGSVELIFDIDELGHPENIRVHSSRPNGVFDHAATSALQQSLFEPVEVNGQAVTVTDLHESYIFKFKPPP